MKTKYKKTLFFLSILLILAFLILISYLQFQKYIENRNPIVLVKDGLSVNYLNGQHVLIKKNNQTYYFSVTNNTDTTLKYYITLENSTIRNNKYLYDLIETNGSLNTLQNEITKDDLTLANAITIEPNETKSYNLKIYGQEENVFSAKLTINLKENNEEYFAETLLNNNDIRQSSLTTIGIENAVENEGLIEANDEYGTYYYFRGKVENNYVSFANLLWRIVKINSDGSIKLILNDYTETTANMYENNTNQSIEEKINMTKNKMYENLNTWYLENLKEYEAHLISNKYCIDDSIFETNNDINYYLGYNRILTDHTISYNCLGTTYTSKIGLLSIDEVIQAGATSILNNTDFYLYIPNKVVSWWTLTPSTSDNENISFFEIDQNGKAVSASNGNYFKGMRPVIYLIKKTSVEGSGTSTDPYIIK